MVLRIHERCCMASEPHRRTQSASMISRLMSACVTRFRHGENRFGVLPSEQVLTPARPRYLGAGDDQ